MYSLFFLSQNVRRQEKLVLVLFNILLIFGASISQDKKWSNFQVYEVGTNRLFWRAVSVSDDAREDSGKKKKPKSFHSVFLLPSSFLLYHQDHLKRLEWNAKTFMNIGKGIHIFFNICYLWYLHNLVVIDKSTKLSRKPGKNHIQSLFSEKRSKQNYSTIAAIIVKVNSCRWNMFSIWTSENILNQCESESVQCCWSVKKSEPVKIAEDCLNAVLAFFCYPQSWHYTGV